MKLKRFLLRYYPPGIILEYEQGGNLKSKSIDLLDLKPETDVDAVVDEITRKEPLITAAKAEQVRKLIERLQEKISQKDDHHFYLFKVLRAHILPLTNVAFNKSGSSLKISYGRLKKRCHLPSIPAYKSSPTAICTDQDGPSHIALTDLGLCSLLHVISRTNNTDPDQLAQYVMADQGLCCLQLDFTYKFITGSYDRTCKVWDTASGEELHTLEGHRNVVYAIAFNNPYGDKIATGSFDKTCKLWSSDTGKCYHTFRGHTSEILSPTANSTDPNLLSHYVLTDLGLCSLLGMISRTNNIDPDLPAHYMMADLGVCLSFNPQSSMIATGSMDTTAKLWDVQTGQEVASLNGHSAEIISLSFNSTGSQLITGSFDHTVSVWDVRTGQRAHTLIGHKAEISSAQFNWDCSLIATGSMDKTCKIWDTATGRCIGTLRGHEDEVLDVAFDFTGQMLLTASADSTARCYNAMTHSVISTITGHEGEISKITFNPQGTSVLTASADKTARLWDPEDGKCKQILEGHTDEIFSCAFNYEGNTIITGSKDNTCRIWR